MLNYSRNVCVYFPCYENTCFTHTHTHTHLPSNVYTEKMAEERMCWNKKERVRPERVFARAYDCETMLGMTEKNHAPRSPLLKGEGTIQIWGHFTIPRSLSRSQPMCNEGGPSGFIAPRAVKKCLFKAVCTNARLIILRQNALLCV